MAVRGQGNPTIIQAAQAAYAHRPAVDYSGYIQGLASISKGLVDGANKAAKKVNELNKAWNVLDFEGAGGAIEQMAWNYRNDPNLTYNQKLEGIRGLKNSINVLETYSSSIGELILNETLSGGEDAKTKSWINALINKRYYGPNSIQDQNNDSKISDEEKLLQPVKIENNQFKILNYDGEYVRVDSLKSSFGSKDDSADIKTMIDKVTRTKSLGGKPKEKYIANEMGNIMNVLNNNKKAKMSLMFDQGFTVADDIFDYTFVDYYLSSEAAVTEGMNEDFKVQYNKFITEGLILDPTTKKYVKYESLAPEVQTQMKQLIVIDAIKNDVNIYDDLEKFIKKVIDYSMDDL